MTTSLACPSLLVRRLPLAVFGFGLTDLFMKKNLSLIVWHTCHSDGRAGREYRRSLEKSEWRCWGERRCDRVMFSFGGFFDGLMIPSITFMIDLSTTIQTVLKNSAPRMSEGASGALIDRLRLNIAKNSALLIITPSLQMLQMSQRKWATVPDQRRSLYKGAD